LGRLLAETERRHPALVAEQREIDIATAQIWQASLYPNPSLLFEYEDPTWTTSPMSRVDWRTGVRVPLVIGGRIRAARRAAEAERDVAALRYVWRRREVTGEVQVAWAQLLGARRVREAALSSRDVATEAVAAARARVDAQVAPESDVLRGSVDLAKAEANLHDARARVVAAGQALVAASTISELDPETVVGEIRSAVRTPALREVLAQVLPLHPLVSIALREQEAARLRVEEARAERMPDVDLELKAGTNDDGDSVVGLGIEIPLPINDSGRAGVAVAEARRRRAISATDVARTEVTRRLSALHQAVLAVQERVRRYETDVLPPARKALEQTRLGHEQGKLTYFEVLDAQRTLSEATAAYAEAQAELIEAAVELETYSGIDLRPLPTESK
jgi:outer membrane protein, heavy metal efflux system